MYELTTDFFAVLVPIVYQPKYQASSSVSPSQSLDVYELTTDFFRVMPILFQAKYTEQETAFIDKYPTESVTYTDKYGESNDQYTRLYPPLQVQKHE